MSGSHGAPWSGARSLRRSALLDVVLVLLTLAVLGVVGGFVWSALVDAPSFVRTAGGAQMDQIQLSDIVTIDGWYFTVAAIGGLLAGIVLMLLRPHRPVLMVVMLTLGGALAAWVMLRVGLAAGPPDPAAVLEHAAVGTRAPVRLRVHAGGVDYAWPGAALLGALLVLLLVSPRRDAAGETADAGD
ncbi:MAG: hypothetical protein ACTHNS_14855 [Marmoricola sp.]